MPFFINQKCTQCGACIPECPTDSIAIIDKHYVIDTDTCTDQMRCVQVCPVSAIERFKKRPSFLPQAPSPSSKKKATPSS